MESNWDGRPQGSVSDHPSSVQCATTSHEGSYPMGKKNSASSGPQVQRPETFINVGKLDGEEDEQQSEAWKRKRRRKLRDHNAMDFMKSCRMKRLKHPLERNPIISGFRGLVNLILILVVSIPSAVLLVLLTPFLLVMKSFRFSSFPCSTNRLSGHDAHFLLHRKQPITHSILIIDGCLDLKRVRYTLAARTGHGDLTYPRLTQLLIHLPSGPFWLNDTSFNINNHVYSGPDISTEEALQKYVASLLYRPLNTARPLWEVVVLNSYAKGRDTVLVCRIHQCVADGISLLRLLCQSLTDNQIMHIPQKPHFGGITYGMNLFRTVIVGPLTIFTWLIWWKPARNLLVYRKSSTHLISSNASSTTVNGSKKCCGGCNGVSGQNSVTSGSSEAVNSLRVGNTSSPYTVFNITDNPGYLVSWTAKIPMNKVTRIKQVTRTCINDVLLTLLTGALRISMKRMGVVNPPDLKVNVAVDLRSSNLPFRTPKLGNKASVVSVTLPLEVEGAIPRIWKLRETMEDMKASADAVTSYCFVWWVYKCLPQAWATILLNRLCTRGSLQYSSLPGPSSALLFGGYAVKHIFNISPPPDPLNLSVTAMTYADHVHLTIVVRRTLPNAKWFAKSILVEMLKQCEQMNESLSYRRLPGEQKRSLFSGSDIHSSRPLTELQARLAKVQAELQSVTEQYEFEFRRGIHSKSHSADLSKYANTPSLEDSIATKERFMAGTSADTEFSERNREVTGMSHRRSAPSVNSHQDLSMKVQYLKQEFTELLTEIRRRKSVHDGGIYIGVAPQIEEEEAEMRKPRNRALSVVSVRSIASIASRDLTSDSKDHLTISKDTADRSSSSSSISSYSMRPPSLPSRISKDQCNDDQTDNCS